MPRAPRFLRPALVALVVFTLLPLSGPAHAAAPRITSEEAVFGDVRHQTFRTATASGAVVRGNLLRFPQHASYLRVRPVLGKDVISGLETLPSMARRERQHRAVAGVNGGFWRWEPPGTPHGVYAEDGELLSGPRTAWGRPGHRGTVGFVPDGTLLFSRMGGTILLTHASGLSVEIDDLNHAPQHVGEAGRPGELLLFTDRYGAGAPVPAGATALVVSGLGVPVLGAAEGVVEAVRRPGADQALAIPADGAVLVAHGPATERLAPAQAGDRITVDAQLNPIDLAAEVWAAAREAMPGGPLIIRNGRITPNADWEGEGFSNHIHNSVRHPRTAIAVTGDGEVLLVTVDGRQPGWSAGMTMFELATMLRDLGALHALSVDGGGSTTMMVGTAVRNRVSDPEPRPIAIGLFVYENYPFNASRRLAGRDRYATAAAVATAGWPDGAREVVLATGAAFPDALAGGPLAAVRGAPLLLTQPGSLPQATVDALTALGPTRVTVLGGRAAVSDAVVRSLQARGITVERLAGDDRFGTAVAVAEALRAHTPPQQVVLASGATFPDALTAAAPAGQLGAPVLLAQPGALPPATAAFLEAAQPQEVVVVGGAAALSTRVEQQAADAARGASISRLFGANRYGTASAILDWAAQALPELDPSGLVVTQGTGFPDALAGGPLAAERRQLLMIVPPADVRAEAAAAAALDARAAAGLQLVTLLGGRQVLTHHQHWQLDQLATR